MIWSVLSLPAVSKPVSCDEYLLMRAEQRGQKPRGRRTSWVAVVSPPFVLLFTLRWLWRSPPSITGSGSWTSGKWKQRKEAWTVLCCFSEFRRAQGERWDCWEGGRSDQPCLAAASCWISSVLLWNPILSQLSFMGMVLLVAVSQLKCSRCQQRATWLWNSRSLIISGKITRAGDGWAASFTGWLCKQVDSCVHEAFWRRAVFKGFHGPAEPSLELCKTWFGLQRTRCRPHTKTYSELETVIFACCTVVGFIVLSFFFFF